MSLLNSELWERHPELAQVLWCLQNGDGFNLYICQYSSLAYRQQLTAALLQHCTAIEISALDLPEQQLIDEALQATLASHPPELPVFFYDLERFLLSIDQQKNLRYVRQLNWRRSGFQRLQRSVVLWLPIAALDLLVRYAPDFYDWCSGFYQFSEPQAASPSFLPAAFENQKVDNLSLTEKQSWLAVLMESLQDDSLEDAERAKQSADVGDLHYMMGNYQEAESYYQQALGLFQQLGYEKGIAMTQGRIANILQACGELDKALRIRQQEQMPVYERLGDVHSRAVTLGQIADILQARGELDEALRIRQQEEMPVYERLGDVHSRAVTLGQIADILYRRGELDEALRILQAELIPVFERLGDARSRAVTLGKIADILCRRGELDEALRIRQETIPVFERLGDVRERAVTLGKIADILYRRGELDEALRIRQQEEMPIYERLGDVRERAVTFGKIADILYIRGELDEALRIRQQEQMPVYERLGDVLSLLITQWKIALLLMKFTPPHREEANQLLCLALAAARKMRIPQEKTIEEWLQHFEMNCPNLNSHN